QIKYVQRFVVATVWRLFAPEVIEQMKQTDDDLFLASEDFPQHVLLRIKEGKRLYYDFVVSSRHAMPEHVRAFFQDAISNFKEVEAPPSPPDNFEDDIPF